MRNVNSGPREAAEGRERALIQHLRRIIAFPQVKESFVLKSAHEILSEMADKGKTTMAEEHQPTAPTEEEDSWYCNSLRNHSTREIEQALGKALSELTGKKYLPHVMKIDYAPEWAGASAAMSNSAEIVLRVSPPPWRPRDDGDMQL